MILEHDHPVLHWDLMLEVAGVLWTWRLPRAPQHGDTVPVERLADHRLAYLDYEGPVSGGRGQVKRWAAGAFVSVETAEGVLMVQLAGAQARWGLRICDGMAEWSTAQGDAVHE